MNWLKRLLGQGEKQTSAEELELPAGMSADLDPEEGGTGPFEKEIAQWRWVAAREAVATARREIDPELWAEGRPAFEFERALAHGHEGLRDRLSNYLAGRIRDAVVVLFEQAANIAAIRHELIDADRHQVRLTRDWRRLYEDVHGDALELGRYYRLSSVRSRLIKWLLVGLFILVEWFAAGAAFNAAIPNDIPYAGFIFSLGLMVMLVAVPHYVALGLKEGITAYHSFEHKDHVDNGRRPPYRISRRRHQEDQDDRGFRITSVVLGVLLLGMIVPLSAIRAGEAGDGESFWLWFAFFALLQVGLSGYFFLREWLDHGTASANLHRATENRERAENERQALVGELSDAIADFHADAEEVFFYLREAPRWDSYVVQSFLETSHYFRHVISVERADLDPFITWASMPFLGTREDARASDLPLLAVAEEHPGLDEDSLFGRDWLMRQVSEALERDGGPAELGPKQVTNWLLTKSPMSILRHYLDVYHGMELRYVPPPEVVDTAPPQLTPQPLDEDEPIAESVEQDDEVPTAQDEEVHAAPPAPIRSSGVISGNEDSQEIEEPEAGSAS